MVISNSLAIKRVVLLTLTPSFSRLETNHLHIPRKLLCLRLRENPGPACQM